MARNPARHDAGSAGAPGVGRADQRVHRLRSDLRFAPRRAPRADLRAAASAAPRRTARGGRRGRDRDDRRSVGAVLGTQSARHRDARSQPRRHPRAAGAVPGLLARSRRGPDGQQPRLARLAVADRLPARHGQALHDPVHAREGLGPGAPGTWAVVHRVQLHAAAGLRLRPPAPGAGRRAADGRRRPMGQHHGRPRADPPDQRGRGGVPSGARAGLQAPADAVRVEVREERSRGFGVAGSEAGPRRTPSTSTGSTPTTGMSARTCAGSPSSDARRSRRSRPSPRLDRMPARRNGRSPATSPRVRTARPPRPRRSAIRRRCSRPARSRTPRCSGRCSSRPAGFAFDPATLAMGAAAFLAEAGVFPSRGEARRTIAGGRRDDQRDAGVGPGVRPGTHRRGVARGPDRQAPPRDRAPGRLSSAAEPLAAVAAPQRGDARRPAGRRARPAGPGRGRGDRRPRRRGRVAGRIGGRGRVVLGGEQQFGGLLGDLATDRVDAAVEQAGRVGARRALRGA